MPRRTVADDEGQREHDRQVNDPADDEQRPHAGSPLRIRSAASMRSLIAPTTRGPSESGMVSRSMGRSDGWLRYFGRDFVVRRCMVIPLSSSANRTLFTLRRLTRADRGRPQQCVAWLLDRLTGRHGRERQPSPARPRRTVEPGASVASRRARTSRADLAAVPGRIVGRLTHPAQVAGASGSVEVDLDRPAT